MITERDHCTTFPAANYFQLARTYTAAGSTEKIHPRCKRRAAHNGEFIDASVLSRSGLSLRFSAGCNEMELVGAVIARDTHREIPSYPTISLSGLLGSSVYQNTGLLKSRGRSRESAGIIKRKEFQLLVKEMEKRPRDEEYQSKSRNAGNGSADPMKGRFLVGSSPTLPKVVARVGLPAVNTAG
jgi:hypothetical protein